MKDLKICVVGLGYVGLPLSVELGKYFQVCGFDIKSKNITMLKKGKDPSCELTDEEVSGSAVRFSDRPDSIGDSDFVIVAVPTPIDDHKVPDLSPLIGATRTVGKNLKPGTTIVFESTVYPGVTEEECVPVLEEMSGLVWKKDFFVGYSPERINPGDKVHTFANIVKVVSGDSPETLEKVAYVYGTAVKAGVHKAPSIKVAEAAKVIENTQRDINIALMNELRIIFDRMGISTRDVLEAAKTKWNFLPFSPGLVGGHCIGVDPYYLTFKAEALGHHAQIISAGRRINDGMGRYFARELIKKMIDANMGVKHSRVLILGITFKENVSDVRNSKVIDIVNELRDFGVEPEIFDPLANPEEVEREYGISLVKKPEIGGYESAILAVSHKEFVEMGKDGLKKYLAPNGILSDIREVL